MLRSPTASRTTPGSEFGPGTVEERVATLQGLGLDIVRVTVHWDSVEAAKGTYDWESTDAVLEQLHTAGIDAVVTLYGTPKWANGGKGPNVAPVRGADFAAFAGAAAERYPFVHRWTIWNEPNQRRWLSTASPAQYVTKLLNPAYTAIHSASRSSKVAGGVTAPRGGTGGLSPVAFIRGMGTSGARLDAYAHHPYALSPKETPWSGGCDHCETITMSTLDRLVTETQEGVQAAGAALADRARLPVESSRSSPRRRARGAGVVHRRGRLQGLGDAARRSPDPVPLPRRADDRSLAERAHLTGRHHEAGARRLRGATRPGEPQGLDDGRVGNDQGRDGARAYRLQRFTTSGWRPVGGVQRTRADGTLQRKVVAKAGTKLRLLANGEPGNILVVR